jgi:hypothetical protein
LLLLLLLVLLLLLFTDLIIHVRDGLLALAVHVEDLQEGLVHALIR